VKTPPHSLLLEEVFFFRRVLCCLRYEGCDEPNLRMRKRPSLFAQDHGITSALTEPILGPQALLLEIRRCLLRRELPLFLSFFSQNNSRLGPLFFTAPLLTPPPKASTMWAMKAWILRRCPLKASRLLRRSFSTSFLPGNTGRLLTIKQPPSLNSFSCGRYSFQLYQKVLVGLSGYFRGFSPLWTLSHLYSFHPPFLRYRFSRPERPPHS